jgi:hypothetical protein
VLFFFSFSGAAKTKDGAIDAAPNSPTFFNQFLLDERDSFFFNGFAIISLFVIIRSFLNYNYFKLYPNTSARRTCPMLKGGSPKESSIIKEVDSGNLNNIDAQMEQYDSFDPK